MSPRDAFPEAVCGVPHVSREYPFRAENMAETLGEPIVGAGQLKHSSNYRGLLIAFVLLGLMILAPVLVIILVIVAGVFFGVGSGVAFLLFVMALRAVLAKPLLGKESVRPGIYYHGSSSTSEAATFMTRWRNANPNFTDLLCYESQYEAKWLWVYRLLDFASMLTGYEASGDACTLFAFASFKNRLPKGTHYTDRCWVRVQGATDGEECLQSYRAECSGDSNPADSTVKAGSAQDSDKDLTLNPLESLTEAIAVDWAFPSEWSEDTKLLILFHGLNGGSGETYVLDALEKAVFPDYDRRIWQSTAKKSSSYAACCVNARGLNSTPVQGDSFFHGARCDDARRAITAILAIWERLCETQPHTRPHKQRHHDAFAIGFSMGALLISQVLDRMKAGDFGEHNGKRLRLSGAVAVSGAFDRTVGEVDFTDKRKFTLRGHNTWHPIIAAACVDTFSRYTRQVAARNDVAAKYQLDAFCSKSEERTEAEKYEPFDVAAAPSEQHKDQSSNGYILRRSFHPVSLDAVAKAQTIRDIDIQLVAPYHGFGFGMRGFYNYCQSQSVRPKNIQHCFLLYLAAVDDPLVPAEAHRPGTLKHAEAHKCISYLTRSGGHVGWPGTNLFDGRNWAFVTDVSFSFFEACSAWVHGK